MYPRMMRTAWRRLAAMLAVVLGLGWLTPVAGACACGAMEPLSGSPTLGVNSETAAILFDGEQETIALSMGLQTESPDVAFLLPLPARSEVEVAGDDLFADLFEYTRPERRTRYSYDLRFWLAGAGDGAGAPVGTGATVVGRQVVGDYDVVQLSGTAAQVGEWLAENGFRVRDEVVNGLGHYLDRGWVVMAVKLSFDGEFEGGTEPLVVRFPTDELVYPMQLSSLATAAQAVRFYVFADHRQQIGIGDRDLDTTFAGWVDAATLTDQGFDDAAALVGQRRWFLTRVDDQLPPRAITGDLRFAADPAGDAEHREVIWVTEERGWVILLAGFGLVLVAIATGTILAVLRHRRSQRAWRNDHSGPIDPSGGDPVL